MRHSLIWWKPPSKRDAQMLNSSPRGKTFEWLGRAALAIVCASVCMPAQADGDQNFVFFTSVDTFNNEFSDPAPESADSFVRPTLDILYTYSGDSFRFLGEYLWSSTEAEMERFKVGWQADASTMVWFGRFHATSKYWTSEYHHGQFMQTTITRPSVEEWEDESGPMPSHLTGLSLEQEHSLSEERVLNWALSAGLAPVFFDDQLHAFDVLDPESDHDLAINARFVFRPEVLQNNQIGVLFGWTNINVISESNPDLSNLDAILQTTVAVFGDWRWDEWRVIANMTFFDNHMEYFDGDIHDQFGAGYFQFEYTANESWTLFGRSDISFDEDNSPYLSLLPAFIAHRNMLGARWDFMPMHSLSAEVAETSVQGSFGDHNTFKEIRFQWSGVFQ